MNVLKMLTWAVLVTPLAVGTIGCERKEGPAEKAGKAIDNAGDKVEESVENAGDKVEEAGDKIEDAVE